MAFEMDERLIADFACLDPTYVDGLARMINLGDNVGSLFLRRSIGGWLRFNAGRAWQQRCRLQKIVAARPAVWRAPRPSARSHPAGTSHPSPRKEGTG
jgi:hypothetical protein